jgi:hypothetical protein
MARHAFPYVPIPIPPSDPFPSGQTVLRPWVITRLTASNGATFVGVSDIDSGADSCVFPVSVATALGLDILQMKQQITGGVGNTGNITHYATVTLEIGQHDQSGNVRYDPELRFDAYVGFTTGLEAQGIGLLGESDFFAKYLVTFDQKNAVFYIE